MKPHSEIVQVVKIGPSHELICLCKDGSLWGFDPSTKTFTLLAVMAEGKYV